MKKILLLFLLAPMIMFSQTFSYQTFFNMSPYSNHLDLELIHIITQARSTIDCHFYDIDRQSIADAFRYAATNHNVKIRILTDSDNYNSVCSNLNSCSNIEVYNDEKTNIYVDGGRESHNKFAVFDFGDSGSPVGNYVWTGSYNITDTGTENNANNVVLIKEPSTNLSAQYEKEFLEMWGADDQPVYEFQFNTDHTSEFGTGKTDNTRHVLSLGSGVSNVEIYFAPSDDVEAHIVSALESADYNILFCIFTFTSDPIRQIITNKFSAGVEVYGVFDAFQKSGTGGEYAVLSNAGIPVVPDALSGLLHHKYIIIDYGHPDSDPIVITGSYNFTASADHYNDENTLIIHDNAMANSFFAEFYQRYTETGKVLTNHFSGSTNTAELPVNREITFLNNYISPQTVLKTISIKCPSNEDVRFYVYSETGELIDEFSSRYQASVEWDVEQAVPPVTTGLYFIKAVSDDAEMMKKVLIIR